ncbi:MAG TPA: acyl-CoA thioesterase domain-containing protein [Burkholderiales bacterium]|nr:acyl-CoA thioesterase domain-containing protein [Burkholderiales bacterium]
MTLNPRIIQDRVLRALAANRAPGFHFPGYFLELTWPHVGPDSISHAMTVGPHCLDAKGVIAPPALGVVIDGALATAPRLVIEPGGRQATVHLDIQYTGLEPRKDLYMEATLEGFFAADSARQAITRGALKSGGETIAHATGTFMVLPPPEGVKLAPLPWQQGDVRPQPLEMSELEEKERAVVRAAQAALSSHDGVHTFFERFVGIEPRHTATGATCRVAIGYQIGNRVGHVQGGILLGLAQATAAAAVPRHPAISNISAWYISPGRGESLTATSKVIHAGRSLAVVRTEIRNADGSLVLEAVSNHASKKA